MELNCLGLACPQPVIRCREAIQTASPAELIVLVDNEAAVENVSRFLNSNGYAAKTVKTAPNEWQIKAKKTGAAAQPSQSGTDAKTLIFIASETLGHGDDSLGAKLMENFLGSLPEFGENLWRIIMVNGGVKLAATPGPCLENLKKLAASGVSILVCGTCLTHYGLLEQKQVGDTTNMLDIITSMDLAEKIIRP